ncbi:MAG: hypothetical protein Q8P23_02840 [bacterium]|nr:hypothetical protein [bacterium]
MNGNAQRNESGPAHTGKPEEPKSAEIVYINDFAEYSAIPGGHLKREEYERVAKAAEEPDVKVNEVYTINAKTYARHADITLSPKSLIMYSVLRGDHDISSELLFGDQQVLAEVLRMEGRADDAQKLIAAYPVTKF